MSDSVLLGIHHVTAMTDDAKRNYHFITEILGMRLIKKTVNQDDIHTYHTFFADDVGNPGTDLTFFDFPDKKKGERGSNAITRIGLRVPDDAALEYYKARFDEFDVKHEGIRDLFGRKVLAFEEPDGQRYRLFSDEEDEGIPGGIPWKGGPVPEDKAIYGLGPIEISISYQDKFVGSLKEIYGMKVVAEEGDAVLLEVGAGGNGGRVIVRKDPGQSAKQGYGEVHHVSFRVKDHDALAGWKERYDDLGLKHTGIVDRFYFEAMYTRVGHILIELSTDGPGFMGDEPYETLGESLALPPFLEPKREEIEAQIKPFDTTRRK
ncbi:ring-cleaving dioxygenase [Salinicoccus halitifaciens]|uniref:Glyoxalase family protein n=1 Tax=Salinicoccus halitifaciens TaxID=1073415 RepID=A0ABV2EAU6_9STAP|nr:ring-cleaving dioxygenase [Salinicoccus halitifaciens]MCD2137638.1 ring-cleaving dioxygenase [Salinicoccus halitifaciens]